MITPFIETADVDRLVEFYRRVFGAEQVDRVPPQGDVFCVMLQIDDAVLGIVRTTDANGDNAGPPEPSQLAPAGRIALDIPVPDPDATLRTIADTGGEAAEQANDMPWGMRIGHARDLDGNELNLSAPVGAVTPSGKE